MPDLATQPVELRGHHLVCLQFLHGGGYSLEFARNILHLREQFEREGAIVSNGHDEICKACPRFLGVPSSCTMCPDDPGQVDELDAYALELLGVQPGDHIGAEELRDRISLILPEWQDHACSSCAWSEVCSSSINLLSRT